VLDAEGAVMRDPEAVPLGADQRRGGDGGDRAFAKIVAGLTGVHMDEVYQRDRHRRRQQVAIWAAVAVVLLALGGTRTFFYWRFHQQGQTIAANQQTLGEIEALVRQYQPVAQAQVAAPGARRDLTAAITAIVQGAATDPRCARVLALLKQGKPGEAEPLLRESPEDMAARSQREASQAAEAFRNLGAIAGLADPTRARGAYARAVALDPDNIDGLAWSGWLELDAGNLDAAERADQRLLTLAQTGQTREEHDDAFWAWLGLGDIAVQRGRLDAALRAYRSAESATRTLAAAEPDDAAWQRDLSASYERVGDVLMTQGNLVLPVIDSAVDRATARSGNACAAGGNRPSFPGRRTNQSIPPIHRASLLTGAARVRVSDNISY
jgi:tetratricopeptide (TPR) repeat protein